MGLDHSPIRSSENQLQDNKNSTSIRLAAIGMTIRRWYNSQVKITVIEFLRTSRGWSNMSKVPKDLTILEFVNNIKGQDELNVFFNEYDSYIQSLAGPAAKDALVKNIEQWYICRYLELDF